jgi:hypothetical protein
MRDILYHRSSLISGTAVVALLGVTGWVVYNILEKTLIIEVNGEAKGKSRRFELKEWVRQGQVNRGFATVERMPLYEAVCTHYPEIKVLTAEERKAVYWKQLDLGATAGYLTGIAALLILGGLAGSRARGLAGSAAAAIPVDPRPLAARMFSQASTVARSDLLGLTTKPVTGRQGRDGCVTLR